MTISSSGTGIAGNPFTLRCLATLISPIPLPYNIPPPSFEWFYGPHGNASLPSGIIQSLRASIDYTTYTSTLQFCSLKQSHAGMYTCRLGAGHLANSTIISVDGNNIYYYEFFSQGRSPMVLIIASYILIQT